MVTSIKAIPLDEIENESNRKYTKDEGFEQLVNSIREHGIIEPPVVRKMTSGGWLIIAGRRRIEALRRVIKEDGGDPKQPVDCVEKEAGDSTGDEEIALAENVNRQEMHPLDEAALFSRMAARGISVNEIAQYYARSPSAIYQRLRLAGLREELKGLFRSGRLTIAGAGVLAELPEADQQKFFELYGEERTDRDGDIIPIEPNVIKSFVAKQQRFRIVACMKQDCKDCAKRTHNQGNELFEEFNGMGDVCLDGECYGRTWKALIEKALAEQADAATLPTDNKIWFSGDILPLLYGKASHVALDVGRSNTHGDKGITSFEVVRNRNYDFTNRAEPTRKKNCCWRIGESPDGIFVQRVGYKQKQSREQPEGGSSSSASAGKEAKGGNKQFERFGKEVLTAIAAERGTTKEALAKQLEVPYDNPWRFKNDIQNLVEARVIARRIEAERSEKEPPRDYFSMCMRAMDEEFFCNNGSFLEKNFSKEQQQWLFALTGKKNVREIVTDEMQMPFHFLLLSVGFDRIPDLEDLKDIKVHSHTDSGDLFWDYAGMSEEEYRALYLEVAREVTAKALVPKAKKGAKEKQS
jgi:ParB/RepB/Spo0J family partition protein